MTEAMTTQNDNALIGFESFDTSDRIMPRISIVQPTSEEGTKGTFRSNLTGDERSEITIVPLTYRKSRIMWGDDLGDDPVCKSRNALVPDPDVESPQCNECAQKLNGKLVEVCAAAQWDNETRQPPQCKLQYNMVALDEDEVPFMMRFSGSAVRPFKSLISGLVMKRKPLCDFRVKMTLKQMKSSKGTYYVPSFSVVGEVDKPGQYVAVATEVMNYRPSDDENI